MMALVAAYLGSLVPVLGWTLAHFLWQGALVGLVLQLLLRTCRTAKVRHDLALAALMLMAVLPVATFLWLKGDVRFVAVPIEFPGLGVRPDVTWETAAVAAWLAGVAVLAIRAAGGLLLIERLRRTATPLPATWAQRCRALHTRMAGSLSVAFAQSEAIAAPLVAGWLKPLVLIPTAALVRLPPDQLEALILHELAHVRRLDAFANLIQTTVETTLFYHPAVWWVSRRVRVEREHCCDDLALTVVRDPALYVRALQAIETMRDAPFGVLAANGGDLRSRAARILGLVSAPAQPALSRTAAILVLTAATAAMTHSAAVQAKPSDAPAPAQTTVAASSASKSLANDAAAKSLPLVGPPDRVVLAQVASPAVALLAVATATPPAPPSAAQGSVAPIVLASAAPSQSVSPLFVTSQGAPPTADVKIEMAGSRDDPVGDVAIWPATAYHANFDGWVTLSCRFDVHGLAEKCDVVSEAPLNRGFGRAALEMRPTFKIAPAQDADGPIDTTKVVAIRFRAPNTQFQETYHSPAFQAFGQVGGGARSEEIVAGAPLPMRAVTMLDFPVWSMAASFDDLVAAYPAKGGGVEGYAVAHCAVERSGALNGCTIIKEEPENRDFGRVALGLAATKFKVAPQLAATHHASPLWVDVPIRMPPPAQLAERTVMAPVWLVGIDPKAPPRVFPPEAVARGQTTGRGVARCTVGADGRLSACVPEAAESDGVAFSEAAAKLASALRMNLWSADAAPVEGGVVHIPIRLNLKGG